MRPVIPTGALAMAFLVACCIPAASNAAPTRPSAEAGPSMTSVACTKKLARRAIRRSGFDRRVRRRLRRWWAGSELGVLEMFTVRRPVCRDLTGDGANEIVVELACCTVSSPRPWAIITRKGGRWRIAYSRVRTLHFDLDVGDFEFDEGDFVAVEEKIPVYDDDDPNCCPSSYRYRYTRWNGRRFVVDGR